MKKIFLDTNVIVRFLTQDRPDQYHACLALIQAIEHGRFLPYSSTIVIFETLFVLTKNYKVPHRIALEKVENLLKMKSLTIIETTNLKKSLSLHKNTGVKLADCLIASQLPPKTILVTFDKDFKKLPITSKTPQQIVKLLETTRK